jgi:hypothetical protein
MLHNNTWTESLGKFLLRAGNAVLDLLRLDMTESKWGHRVMDQIFREGKFAPHSTDKAHRDYQRHG